VRGARACERRESLREPGRERGLGERRERVSETLSVLARRVTYLSQQQRAIKTREIPAVPRRCPVKTTTIKENDSVRLNRVWEETTRLWNE
jgi:hypothetical protein